MDIGEAIAGRRSVRKYSHQAVDEPTIQRLIEAAIQAPSAVNEQPWAFTVVRDQALLNRISNSAKKHMLAAMPLDGSAGPSAEHYRSTLGDPAFQIFYHAPVLIRISGRTSSTCTVEDCALAAENLMLMCHALRLGSCWIGFAQSYLSTPAGKQMLELPAAWVPVAPIIVGHPHMPASPVARNAPQVRWIG